MQNAVGLLETAPQDAAQLGNQGHPAASALLTCASEHSDKVSQLVVQSTASARHVWRLDVLPRCTAASVPFMLILCCCVQDVKLYAALCLAYLLRIHAPETPFDNDEDLKVGSSLP
jgi:hypothetical protein